MFTKRALIRDPMTPPGQPAPINLDCECGQRLPVPAPFSEAQIKCPCGIVYASTGWIVERPQQRLASEPIAASLLRLQ